MFHRLALLLVLLCVSTGAAEARTSKKKSKKYTTALAEKKHTKVKVCSEKMVTKGKKTRKKKVCAYHKQYEGSKVSTAELRTEPLERPSGAIHVKSANLQEELEVNIYAADGSFDEAVLAQLDEIFRCKRTHTVRAVDPRLYEQLSRIYDHFGGETLELVSGFRNQDDTGSRHFHASAMEIKVSNHSIKEVYEYAQSLDAGGMGIGFDPHSGFVHVDFRAPGEKSTRWTDWSYPGSDGKASAKKPTKKKPRKTRATRPTS
jgi:uncharacterized protein YcbK (DUF882 family)